MFFAKFILTPMRFVVLDACIKVNSFLNMYYNHAGVKNKVLLDDNILNRSYTLCPYAQYPPIARGNKHMATIKYATCTPLHIDTRDGFFSLEGMVACKII